jgi:hypothetical protein
MSKWYGAGGHWINEGLPMYVAIDRKPENGCETQNSVSGRSGVMLRLKLATTAEDESARTEAASSGILHATTVLKALVLPWARTAALSLPTRTSLRLRAQKRVVQGGLEIYRGFQDCHPPIPHF